MPDIYGTPVALHAHTLMQAGSSMSHENRQPYLAVNYIISLKGCIPISTRDPDDNRNKKLQ